MAETIGDKQPTARQLRLRRLRLKPLVLVLLLLFFLWFALDLGYVADGAENDYATHADVILVLGCNIVGHGGPSPCIAARAGHAADLYKRGLASAIIATGGPVESTTTESEVLAQVLEADGVPHDAIIQENRALNTIQNMAYSQTIMREHGWHTAILVTEPFHIKRATLIARDDGMTVYPSPAVDSVNWQNFLLKALNVSRDTLSLMLYQVKSLVGDRT
jgi:uncharacterized SAM-binding protein YcdF (DUF218 family)